MPARSDGDRLGVSRTAMPSPRALRSARSARGARAGVGFMMCGLRIICSSPRSCPRVIVAKLAGSELLLR